MTNVLTNWKDDFLTQRHDTTLLQMQNNKTNKNVLKSQIEGHRIIFNLCITAIYLDYQNRCHAMSQMYLNTRFLALF